MRIFDNSNLAESYSGVTTPLTFSFARYVYQEVYKNFCKMMGVSEKVIEENSDMFPEMVVSIGGRMYYDLTNWYRLVSLLPGYSFNRGFFEKMLGVEKETDFKKEIPKAFIEKWLFYFPKTLWQTIRITISFIFMGLLVKRFNSNFDIIYRDYVGKDLSQEGEKVLKNIFRHFMDTLVVRWRVPIANDFAVMVSTGITHKLFNKWLPQHNSYEFLYFGSTSPLVSLDPGLLVADIVKTIKGNKEFFVLFGSNKTAEEIFDVLRKRYKEHLISKKIFDYIKRYGDRMPGELKLESKSLNERPEALVQIIANIIKEKQIGLPKNIQQNVLKDLGLSMFKRMVVFVFLGWAKKSIRMREETRFKRTLIFGLARKIFLELGKKYSERGIIDTSDDISYLTLEEIFEDTSSSSGRFKRVIKERKIFLVSWKDIELPRRIETKLPIKVFEGSYGKEKINSKINGTMRGRVVSTGNLSSLSGEVLVMKDFDSAASFNDKIVITSHTDPGWSLVFPFIRGLVVERGGILSHAAIVAREWGIPCIIGIENATDMINTGEKIELNLISGEVIKK